MYDIITLTLPADEYYTDVIYDSDHNLHVHLLNTTEFKGIIHEDNSVKFPGCSKESYKGVSMNRIQVEDDTIKMELQTKGTVQSRIIKESVKNCGFKVE